MMQIHLSDTQAVILSAACARDDRNVFPVVTPLKGGAVNMVLNSLLKKGLVEEIPANSPATVWRHGDDGTPLTLRATPAACAALRIEAEIAPEGADTAPEEEPATDMAAEPETPPIGAHSAPRARKTRAGTKQEALVAVLRRPEGATTAQIAETTGWQRHTIRAAISVAVKKKLGRTVTAQRIRTEGQGSTTIYRIVG